MDLLRSEQLHRRYRLALLYRSSRKYETDVVKHVDERVAKVGLRLFSNQAAAESCWVLRQPRFVSRALRYLLYATSRNPVYDLLNYRRISTALRGLDPAIVHINNGGWPGARNALLTCRAAAKQGCKVILHVHNLASPSLVGPYARTIDKWAIDSSSVIIAVSQATADSLARLRQVPSDQIVVRANSAGPDAESWAASRVTDSAAAEGKPFLLVALGSLERRKGFDCLIDAVGLLHNDIPNLRCEIYGIGPWHHLLCERIRGSALETVIALPGFTADPLRKISDADILVQPARALESFGLTLVEAMVLSKPVVASHVGGMPEVLADGECGVLVPPDDPYALAEAIRHLWESPALRSQLGGSGNQRYWAEYSYARFVAQMVELYEES